MPHQRRHSSAHVAQRALAMLAALQEGERSRDELIAEVESQVGDNAYSHSPEDSFENDKKFLHDLGIITNENTIVRETP